jgi:hypothetical protein
MIATKQPVASRNDYLELLARLDAAGIPYAVLHGWHLLDRASVSDLDIVVDPVDLPRLKEWLHDHYQILSVLQYESTGFAFALFVADGLSSPFHLDVVTDYRCRGGIFLTAAQLLRHRFRWNAIWVIGPSEEFAYLILKRIYEKSSISPDQLARLRLLMGMDTHAFEILTTYFSASQARTMVRLIANIDEIEMTRRIRHFRSTLSWRIIMRHPLRALAYWVQEIGRLWARYCHPAGLLVAIRGNRQRIETLLPLIQDGLEPVFRRIVIYPKQCRRRTGAVRYLTDYLLIIRPLLVRAAFVLLDSRDIDFPQDVRLTPRLVRRFLPEAELMLTMHEDTWRLQTFSCSFSVSGTFVSIISTAHHITFTLAKYLTERYQPQCQERPQQVLHST